MDIPRLIPELSIQPEYQSFVDDSIRNLVSALKGNLHSLYMCGSVAIGQALPDQSDADFTIVTNDPLSSDEIERIALIKRQLLARHSFVTKIDTLSCTVTQALSEPYYWGFWVGLVSHCVYGSDLSPRIPAIQSARDLTIGLCSDTVDTIQRKLNDLSAAHDPQQRTAICRKTARSLIRALVALTVVELERWTDSLPESRAALDQVLPQHHELVETLFLRYEHPTSDPCEIRRFTDETMELYQRKHSRL